MEALTSPPVSNVRESLKRLFVTLSVPACFNRYSPLKKAKHFPHDARFSLPPKVLKKNRESEQGISQGPSSFP
jgi:hypothetical protein